MTTLNLSEISIALSVQKLNPTVLTPDFLKYSGIVPTDWELARPPLLSQMAAQIIFKNGVTIIAQPNRLSVSERIVERNIEEVCVGAITSRLIEILPQIAYGGVNTSFRGHATFGDEPQSARQYLFGTLLAPGEWQNVGTVPPQAALRLTHRLEDAQLVLEIEEAGLRVPEKTIVPIVVFVGNFARSAAKDNDASERRTKLSQIIGNWQRDLATYQEIVSTKFLSSNQGNVFASQF